MGRLTEKEYMMQRAILFDDWSEYDKEYPSTLAEDIIEVLLFVPRLVKNWLIG